jgi:FixJ family two-component response regulator
LAIWGGTSGIWFKYNTTCEWCESDGQAKPPAKPPAALFLQNELRVTKRIRRLLSLLFPWPESLGSQSVATGCPFNAELANGSGPPIIFITGHGDIPSSVRAMKAGAIEFLPKPFGDEDLLKAIDAAIALDRAARKERAELADLRKHHSLLTPREREVLPFVVAGLANKQTAAELGTSEITIGVHRGQIMRKMGAQSLADLVRMEDKLGVSRSKSDLSE